MSKRLTPRSSVENLKREAKRWLKALRAGDAAARQRLAMVAPNAPAEPTLRDIHHALALEYGHAGWTALTAAVDAIGRSHRADSHDQDPDLSALLDAASRGDVAAVRDVLDRRPELASERGRLPGHTGLRSALHFAVGAISHPPEARAEQTVRLLLERGADPNARDEGDNAYPLHFAAEKEHLPIITLLIEHGAEPIGAGDDHELEVIGWATVFGTARRDVVDYLLAHGARHNIASAVATGSVDDIRAIVAASPAMRDRKMDRANRHRRPLHLAVMKKQIASLRTLLELGANPELEDAAGLTPLDQAALNDETTMVDLLIANGAALRLPAAISLGRDVDRALREQGSDLAPGRRWGTLIVRAAERAPGRVVELLLRHGASPNAIDSDGTSIDSASGYTALHAAAFHGNADAVAVLLAHGASVTARDGRFHGTPAGWADYARHTDVRDMILRGPIDMFDAVAYDRIGRFREIFDRDTGSLNRPIGKSLMRAPEPSEWMQPWWTPLAYAVTLAKPAAARELLELGADTRVLATDRITLRQLAERREDREVLDVLDAYGVDRPVGEMNVHLADSDALVARFLANACPDHHVRGGTAHVVAQGIARQILAAHPEIARANLYTAVVCGEVDYVREVLGRDPAAARDRRGPNGSAVEQSAGFIVGVSASAAHPRWEALLYACFARLDHPAANDNAVAIVRALLHHGADPNAYFMAGDSRYSPLTGVAGEGEENRLPHPRRDELVRLLLESGANPYDLQVYYNLHFDGDYLWYLRLAYDESLKRGRGRDWDDPEWRMFDMGAYGSGARFLLAIAIRRNDLALARWALEHGANPNAAPPADRRFAQGSLYEEARRAGLDEMAELFIAHGATPSAAPVDTTAAFVRACSRRDRDAAQRLLIRDPTLVQSHLALHAAAERDDREMAAFILDLGVSADVVDQEKGGQTALHIAAFRDSAAVADLLVRRGADVDRRERNYGATPLGFAGYAQKQRVIDLLVPHSSDIWNVVFAGAVERARDVLDAHPELADAAYPDDGTTPLMRLPADEVAALEVATLLLAHGADPSRRNSEGLTAADLARSRGMERVADLLAS